MEQITLSNLQKLIKTGIESQHESAYWVIAEINELKINAAGHCYIELVEKSDKTDFVQAKVSAVIWASMYRLLKSYFETSTGKQLDSGIKVLVKAYVQYHELYGLSLNIIDIDPSYTVGSIELQRQKTITQLQEEGVFEMNRELEFPLLPQRIAIISSPQAAGYQDFTQQLLENEYGYSFRTQLFPAALQGKDAEKSIIAALDSIYTQTERFDVVAIIRGGGSQADLSCFDSYRLAFHVTQFPLPVLTGIGHDKDISITDMVANQMLKTPTAVATFLVNAMVEQESNLMELAAQLEEIVQAATSNEIDNLNQYALRMQAVISSSISKEEMKLNEWLPKQIRTASQHLVKQHEQKLIQLSMKVEMSNPQSILKRGYSLTLKNGKPINSVNNIVEGDVLETLVLDGIIKSEVKNSGKYEKE